MNYFNGSIEPGELPNLEDLHSLNDFDRAARNYLSEYAYTYFRAGAGAEYSYRNNLEAFHRVTLRPRMMRDISNVESTFETTSLGYNFSAPFFIAPCARNELLHPDGELNVVAAAAERNILYMTSDYADKSPEELYEARLRAAGSNITTPTRYDNGSFDSFAGVETEVQPFFQQMYISGDNFTADIEAMRAYQRLGARAFVITIDAPASSNRIRAARYEEKNPEA